MSDLTNLPITDQCTKQPPDARRLFEGLQDWQGPLPADAKRRVLALLKKPSQETWDDAFTILLQPPKLTLWAAVQAVDPSYPRTSPRAANGRCLWSIPDQLTIARALRHARRAPRVP